MNRKQTIPLLFLSVIGRSLAADSTLVLTDLNLTPKLVDAACGGSIKASLTITGASSAFSSGAMEFESPAPAKQAYLSAIRGPDSNGAFVAAFGLGGLAAGSWTIKQIVLNDTSGNSRRYAAAELQTLGFPAAFDVVSAAAAVTKFTVTPLVIDTTKSAAAVTFTAHITENIWGFGGGSVQITSPTNKTRTASFGFAPVSGTLNDGDFTASLAFPAFSEPGKWTVTNISLRNGCGTASTAESTASLTVTSVQDVSPPALTAFDFTPKTVTVTAAPADVTFTFTVTDDLSGFGDVGLAKCIDGFARLTSPSGADRLLKACITKRTTGDTKKGTYEGKITIPVYAEPGQWRVTELSLQDALGNRIDYGTPLPAGLTLNAASGAITGTPDSSAAGSFNFTARVDDSTKPRVLTAVKAFPGVIANGLQILTDSLPDAVRDTFYTATISAAGGTQPYTWSMSPAEPPAGLSINSGRISGTPTGTGTFNFTVDVSDSSSPPKKASRRFSLSTLVLGITPADLPNGAVGVPYSVTFSAAGGAAPVSWTLTGILPGGLTFDGGNGTISGTPAVPGTFAFSVTAADGSKPAKSATLSFRVDIGLLEISTATLPNGAAGVAYSASLLATGGVAPYTWTSGPNLKALGFPWELAVVDANPDDTSPSLSPAQGFDFTPKVISTTSAPAVVTATLHIIDKLSGFDSGPLHTSVVEFISPTNKILTAQISSTAITGKGDAKDGTFSAQFTFPAFAELGTWRVSKIQLWDAVGNNTVYETKEIAGLGFPVELLNGTKQVTITPASLDFGNQPVGVESSAKPVTIASIGTAPLEVDSLKTAGTNAGDFIITESAPITVAVGTPKIVYVVFKPSAGGARSASLTLTQSGETKTVSLSGIGQAPNSVAITASPNAPVFGNQVTFTASVAGSSGGAIPTGTVSFADAATALGTATLSAGSAILRVSGFDAGVHSITASYGGDGNYNSAISPALTLTVEKQATTLSLASSPNPPLFGQPITFTTILSPAAATGQVQFFDGSTVIGSSDLNAGKASITLSSLSLGMHSISAVYGGERNFEGSTAPALQPEVVRTATLAITATASRDPVRVGDQLTYTLNIINKGRGAANAVTVTDTLPATVGLIFVQPVLPTASCSGTTVITCDLGTLPSGTSTSITIVVATGVTGTITNTASVGAAEAGADQRQTVVTNTSVRPGFDNQ